MELAKKLTELRKANGYSQEDLAEKLLVSRQAISKWERGEALPDTENLIALARLYGVSLDELVGNEVKKQEKEEEIPVVEVEDESDEDDDCDLDLEEKEGEHPVLTAFNKFPYPIVALIAFLLLGFLCNGWWIAWIVFLTIPIYYSIISAIRKRKLSDFAYPVLITCVYLFIGLWWGVWHPGWILFISVPLFYTIAELIEKRKK
jgi:transcriptional regulator with XRE-family HTH domain